jgi:hypothetical protein
VAFGVGRLLLGAGKLIRLHDTFRAERSDAEARGKNVRIAEINTKIINKLTNIV